ncbi:MAG TPA: hypothetical protein DCS21_12480 [Gammaproteobacteria bacterium]|nr:hypothetical protein [Gammaproteobacteria bacterium]
MTTPAEVDAQDLMQSVWTLLREASPVTGPVLFTVEPTPETLASVDASLLDSIAILNGVPNEK